MKRLQEVFEEVCEILQDNLAGLEKVSQGSFWRFKKSLVVGFIEKVLADLKEV